MATYAATVPPWMVSYATLPGRCRGARGDNLCEGITLGRKAFGEVPGAQFAAFAYCWRRFGPPWFGSDPDKDLVQYVLGTPNPDIFLTLGLSASPLPYAVGYLITEDLSMTFGTARRAWETRFDEWWTWARATPAQQALLAMASIVPDDEAVTARLEVLREDYWRDRLDHVVLLEAARSIGDPPGDEDPTGCLVVSTAILAALRELLRPVFIRDVPMNILGGLHDDDLDHREVAPASCYAGCGIPQSAMPQALAPKED